MNIKTLRGGFFIMKKVIAIISTLLLSITMLIGCGSSSDSVSVSKDLINYNNNLMPALITLDTKITKDFTDQVGSSSNTNETLAAKLKDVIIPESNDLIAKANAIATETEDVQNLHAKYIAEVTEQGEGFALLLQAVQNNDTKIEDSANAKVEDSMKLLTEYEAALKDLKDKNKVVDAKK